MVVLKNNNGSILLGFVLAVAMAVVSSFYFQSQLLTQSIASTYSQVLAISLNSQRLTLRSLTNDAASRARSLAEAPNATVNNCKTNPAFDCPSGENDFVVYDRSGNLIIDSRDTSTSGFSKLGIACNTFSAGAGNNDCPYRYKIVWFAECPPVGICSLPTVYVKGYIQYQPADGSTSKLNPANYEFVVSI